MTQHSVLLSETQTADAMLRARARLVVPGGMWGHLNASRLPEGYPQFFASAEGCRVRRATTSVPEDPGNGRELGALRHGGAAMTSAQRR